MPPMIAIRRNLVTNGWPSVLQTSPHEALARLFVLLANKLRGNQAGNKIDTSTDFAVLGMAELYNDPYLRQWRRFDRVPKPVERLMLRLGVLGVVFLAACDAPNPDDALRAMILDIEAATESRDTGFFREVIAESYQDSHGNDRERAIDVIRGFFLVNSRIEAIVRVQDVILDGAQSAEVSLQLALLSEAGGRSLLGVDGDFYFVDLEFLRIGGDWRIIGAGWRKAL